jgi:outer membrane protein assembly factor BamB
MARCLRSALGMSARLMLRIGFVFLTGCFSVLAASPPKDGPVPSPEPGWPQWRGPRRDGVSGETGLLKHWPEQGPPLLWKTEGIGRGWSSPIVVDGLIYLTGDKDGEVMVQCLEADGRVRWSVSNGGAWTKNYAGSRSSCVYSEGLVYHMNAHGRVAAFDARTGEERWSLASVLDAFGGKNITWGMTDCLLIDGERLLVSPVGTEGCVVALNKRDGKVLWRGESLEGDKAAYSSLGLVRMGARSVLIGTTSHHGIGLDAENGRLLWKVPVRNNWGATCCAPVFGEGMVFYAAPDGAPGSAYRINGDAEKIDPVLVWRNDVDPLTGAGILKDGVFYTNGCKKSAALHAIDWKTGESRYEIQLSSPTNNHATGALLWADDRLYGLFENGLVALIRPTADRFEMDGRFQLAKVSGSDAWSHPVLLEGRLYLRYHDTLWCFDVRAR